MYNICKSFKSEFKNSDSGLSFHFALISVNGVDLNLCELVLQRILQENRAYVRKRRAFAN